MGTALWIGGGIVLVALAAWRLRRAARTVDRILTEERQRPADEDADGTDEKVELSEGQRKPDAGANGEPRG